jgi:tRNA(fMet)-specific endonuclease VapC
METKIICLDTSVLIEYFRNRTKENSVFFKLSEQNFSFAVTSITTFEIYRGVTDLQKSFWDEVFAQMEILSFDEGASKIAATILQTLSKKNRQIALPDLFIASVAIEQNIKLATLNRKDFEKIGISNLLVDLK